MLESVPYASTQAGPTSTMARCWTSPMALRNWRPWATPRMLLSRGAAASRTSFLVSSLPPPLLTASPSLSLPPAIQAWEAIRLPQPQQTQLDSQLDSTHCHAKALRVGIVQVFDGKAVSSPMVMHPGIPARIDRWS